MALLSNLLESTMEPSSILNFIEISAPKTQFLHGLPNVNEIIIIHVICTAHNESKTIQISPSTTTRTSAGLFEKWISWLEKTVTTGFTGM